MQYDWTNKGTVRAVGTTRNTARETGFTLVKRIGRKNTNVLVDASKDDILRAYMNERNLITLDMLDGRIKSATISIKQIRKVGTFEGTVAVPAIDFYAEDVRFIKGMHLEMIDGKIIRTMLKP